MLNTKVLKQYTETSAESLQKELDSYLEDGWQIKSQGHHDDLIITIFVKEIVPETVRSSLSNKAKQAIMDGFQEKMEEFSEL